MNNQIEKKVVYSVNTRDFIKVPSSPIAYWVDKAIIKMFTEFNSVSHWGTPRQGLASGNNELFLREWYEVNYIKIGFGINNVKEIDVNDLLYVYAYRMISFLLQFKIKYIKNTYSIDLF